MDRRSAHAIRRLVTTCPEALDRLCEEVIGLRIENARLLSQRVRIERLLEDAEHILRPKRRQAKVGG